jgi:hypothetical protein
MDVLKITTALFGLLDSIYNKKILNASKINLIIKGIPGHDFTKFSSG